MQDEQQMITAVAADYAHQTGSESAKEDFIAGVVFWGNRTAELLKSLTPGVQKIAVERQKQIDKHGFTAEHHVNHPEWYDNKQLIVAAASLLLQDLTPEQASGNYPENWDAEWFANLLARPEAERVEIAGALLAAEIDRTDMIDELCLMPCTGCSKHFPLEWMTPQESDSEWFCAGCWTELAPGMKKDMEDAQREGLI